MMASLLLLLHLSLPLPVDCREWFYACWSLDAACAAEVHEYGNGSCRPARRCFDEWATVCR